MQPWWERHQGRLEYELDALDRAGIIWAKDAAAWDKGLLRLDLTTSFEDRVVNLTAVFPDLYPYFRFEIAAPGEDLERHQHPLSKYLCLLGRRTDNWEVTDTLADFVVNRVPLALSIGTLAATDEGLEGVNEEAQGEPFSDYYPYERNSVVLIDSGWELDVSAGKGALHLRVASGTGQLLRGAVSRVVDDSGKTIAGMTEAVKGSFSVPLKGRWFRVPKAIRAVDVQGFVDALDAIHPGAGKPKPGKVEDQYIDVIGVVFPEEQAWRSMGDGWTFLVRVRDKPAGGERRWLTYFARPGRAGQIDMSMRVPELSPMSEKAIAVVGLGGIGAPIALEFARAGVKELRLLDFDHMEPGTSTRWPLGLPMAGLSKTELGAFIKAHWPYTDVISVCERIGGTRAPTGKPDSDVMTDLVEGVDLLFDAAAEPGLSYFLSEVAREQQIPYVVANTSTGAWGGRVVRVRPDPTTGCWVCLMEHLTDGSVPETSADPAGEIQPTGCADPTFTGTGFDITPVIGEAARMSIATLCEGADGYPPMEWDIGVLSLRDSTGKLIAPAWWTDELRSHPRCDRCRRAA